MKTKISGNVWTIEVLTPRQMKRHRADGDELGGLCVPGERAIYISDDSVDYITIAHELYHAYWSYLYLDDTNNVKIGDIEEIAAGMFADKGAEIVKKAKRITKQLEKGK